MCDIISTNSRVADLFCYRGNENQKYDGCDVGYDDK